MTGSTEGDYPGQNAPKGLDERQGVRVVYMAMVTPGRSLAIPVDHRAECAVCSWAYGEGWLELSNGAQVVYAFNSGDVVLVVQWVQNHLSGEMHRKAWEYWKSVA